MATGSNELHFQDGSLDFSGGVDSVKVPTVASPQAPGGLARNQLAWLINATTRDGGILQRPGWIRLGQIHSGSGLYQGGIMHAPFNANPYLIISIGGEIFKVMPDFPAPINLSAAFGEANPASQEQAFFVQGNEFTIIQAGDNVTLPLFWDDNTLRRSVGITTSAVPPGTPGVNEIPAGTTMDYYQGRLWYAKGRQYSAGDMVGGLSGTVAVNFRDSILNVTENPLVIGGDGFSVPSNAGNIRALFHNANINAQLGEGQLLIGTRKAIYAQQVPTTRNDWIAATANNQPIQTVVQLINGPVNDRSIVKVNGDIFYQTLEPSIASLFASVRNFGQWGNRSISSNEQRLLNFVDRSLMHGSTGVLFNNRVLQATLPKSTPQGIVNQVIIPMDLIPVSSFAVESSPTWEGSYEGLDVLQLFSGDFGGRERCFAVSVSKTDGSIELWELTDFAKQDVNSSGESRVTWVVETPAFTWGREFELKKLVSAEFMFDKLFGRVDFTVEYREDSNVCWRHWHHWTECTARNSCENLIEPVCYPIDEYRESYRATVTLPVPPVGCSSPTGRPSNVAYQFQLRITVKGWVRIRGIILHAQAVDRRLYAGLRC